MTYLYHRVPQSFTGSILYPLNVLKTKLPKRYASQVKKYAGRELLTRQIVPPLGCLWNDVLHFSPVHPAQIKAGLTAAGFEPKAMQWFAVDPITAGLNQHNAAIYLYPAKRFVDFRKMANDFTSFNLEALKGFKELPKATLTYYQESKQAGRAPLLFHRIPHILYQGSLSLNQMTLITV